MNTPKNAVPCHVPFEGGATLGAPGQRSLECSTMRECQYGAVRLVSWPLMPPHE